MTFPLTGALLAVVATIAPGDGPKSREDAPPACAAIPLYESGRSAGTACDEAPGAANVVVDLTDDWTPRIFVDSADRPQAYRAMFVALAAERTADGRPVASRDRYLELFGIFPNLSVIRRRLFDDERHACHAAIDDGALRWLGLGTLRPDDGVTPVSAAKRTARRAAVAVVQRHLACEGLLPQHARDGQLDAATQQGLASYQHRHMVPSRPVVDAETRETLLTPSRELDFRTLLRALRERVVDATGLIEDGSALNAWEPVLGRSIESAEYRHELRPAPLEDGAPDLIARATEAAARALGWTSPDDAARALATPPPPRVAVRVPPLPAYHGGPMRLRAEIDRGDVWTPYPLDWAGHPRPSPAKLRPTLTLFVTTPEGDRPLVRWPTTIGAWKSEKLDENEDALRYKPSPVGRRYWRDVVVAPAWLPPPTTPDRELVKRGPQGQWIADEDAVGPGYRSAYGLVALVHHRLVVTGGGIQLVDADDIRTHGSGNYRSILRGSSHGCHRLFNHLAVRLGAFLLGHVDSQPHGPMETRYVRTVSWKGHTFKLRVGTRGFRYELVPPVPVEVLPGRIVRSRPAGARPAQPETPAPAPTAAPPAPQASGGSADDVDRIG